MADRLPLAIPKFVQRARFLSLMQHGRIREGLKSRRAGCAARRRRWLRPFESFMVPNNQARSVAVLEPPLRLAAQPPSQLSRGNIIQPDAIKSLQTS